MTKLRSARNLRSWLIVVATLWAVASATAVSADEGHLTGETVPTLGSCYFDLPKKASTIVYVASSGSLRSDFRIPHSIARVGRQEVVVPTEAVPLFVVLAGREPIEWSFLIPPGAQIAGVLILGLGDQVVTGLPRGIEAGFSILKSDGEGADEGPNCPHLSTANAGFDLRSIEKLLLAEFGRPIDKAEVAAPLGCPYQECVSLARPTRSLMQRFLDYWNRSDRRQPAIEVRASGRFIFRHDAQ